jgi:hypothetical protein
MPNATTEDKGGVYRSNDVPWNRLVRVTSSITLNPAHAAYPGALVTNEYIAFTQQRDSAFHSRYRFYGG